MSKPPKIVIPGLNRGNGIAGGFIVGRLKGKGPAQLLGLNALRQAGLATAAGVVQSTSSTASTAASQTASLSTGISTVVSGSISTVNSRIDSLSTAGGGGADDDTALSSSLSSAVSTNVTQSTSLSQISSSLSGAISSTSSLSTAEIAAIAAATGSGGTIPDGIVSGCGWLYSGTGLTFNMSAGSFYLDNTLITATAQSVTLSAADATNPRIDVLYVDSSGLFGKVTGTAAADPSQPPVDPTTQLYLTFVLVPALATTITGITNENIYLEGAEWTGSTSGSGFTLNSTNNPFAGTKDIEGTAVAAAAYVKLVRSSSVSFDGAGNLTFQIRSKATWNSKRWLTFQWYLADVAKGVQVNVKSGTFGFDSSITSGYQLIVIPKTQFTVPAGADIDQLRIVDVGGSIGFYLDNIILQSTGTSTGGGGTGGITQAQADARYLLLTVGSTSLSQISSSLSGAISSTSSLSTAVSTVDANQSTSISINLSKINSLSTAVGGGGGGPDPGQSTSLSQISSSLSGAISSTSSLSTAVSTGLSTTNSTNVTQSTSLSQISSSLSGAISSTSSLSTAVSTVVSGSISAANSRIDSLSTAVGTGGGGPDAGQSTSLSQISSSLSGAISSTSSLSTAVSTVDSNQSTSLSQISSSLSGGISSTTSLSTAVSTVDSNQSTSLSQISASLSSAVSSTTSLSTAAGYLGVPQNIQNGSYTTVLADSGKHLYHTSASAHTWTIDSNANVAYDIGTILTFLNESGGGVVTLAITSDTLRWGSSTGSRSLAANATATAVKVTATAWRLTGDGIT